MLVRVKTIGSGKPDDPFRAPLPTYREILTLHDQGVVYALIPDSDFPDGSDKDLAGYEQTGHGPMLTGLTPAAHERWYEHLDKRYKEHKGEFRPEVV